MSKLKFYLITLVCLFVIINTIRSMDGLYKAQGRLVSEKQKLENTQNELKRLEKQKKWVESTDYVEEQARNVLGMGKPGEIAIILPENLNRAPVNTVSNEEPNWRKWEKLIIN